MRTRGSLRIGPAKVALADLALANAEQIARALACLSCMIAASPGAAQPGLRVGP